MAVVVDVVDSYVVVDVTYDMDSVTAVVSSIDRSFSSDKFFTTGLINRMSIINDDADDDVDDGGEDDDDEHDEDDNDPFDDEEDDT